jgi:hypothetical protein
MKEEEKQRSGTSIIPLFLFFALIDKSACFSGWRPCHSWAESGMD